MAGLALARPSFAEEIQSPVAHGLLANNKLAKAFESAPPQLPDVKIAGPDGAFELSTLLGRTILMPIWAEWCAPCLKELSDFALLQRQFGNDKFAIIPILSGPRKAVTPQALTDVFEILHASVFKPLIEDNFGSRLMRTMAKKDGTFFVPCNVLIAPDGHVIGREIGLKENPQAAEERRISLWGSAAGEEFAAVMASGLFE